MALNNFECNHLMPLHFKGLKWLYNFIFCTISIVLLFEMQTKYDDDDDDGSHNTTAYDRQPVFFYLVCALASPAMEH